LSDFFTVPNYVPGQPQAEETAWEPFAASSRFRLRIAPDGMVSVATSPGPFFVEFKDTETVIEPDRWHVFDLDWDCPKGVCTLAINGEHVADLPQLSRAVGLCYLKLWMACYPLELDGLLVESVDVKVDN
jgi:hypothetical protein